MLFLYGSLEIKLKEGSTSIEFMDDCPRGLVMKNNTCICHPLLSKYDVTCDVGAGVIKCMIRI